MACRRHVLLLLIGSVFFHEKNGTFAQFLQPRNKFNVIYEWKTLDYNWPTQEERAESIKNGSFIVKNNAISGIKLWKGRTYLTVPRQHPGVPVTLTVVPVGASKSPNLEAFPNWAMQKIGDCSAFQFVQSMEIDLEGRMWVIDTGRLNILDPNPPPSTCPPKLVIIDLNSKDFPIVRSHDFPDDVVSHAGNYLNDIVLDNSNGGYAYMTDLGDPGIAVYSYKENRSWKVRDEKTMTFDSSINSLVVNNVTLTRQIIMLGNVDGIALTPAKTAMNYTRTLYYCPLASFDLYSISTGVLQNPPSDGKIPASLITHVGRKKSITDGMMMDNRDNLYFGIIQFNELVVWNTKRTPFNNNVRVLAQNNNTLQWLDGFAIDETQNLYIVTNKLQDILVQKVDTDVVNYRILKGFIGSLNYQHPAPPFSPFIF